MGVERPHARQAMVESAFQQALGTGQQWLTTSTELRVLGGLCVTENCRTLTAHLARAADDSRIVILRVDEPDSSLVHLAQYSFQSITALQEKLAQYPRGASFTLDVGALDPAMATSVVSRIRRFALNHGVRIDRQP